MDETLGCLDGMYVSLVDAGALACEMTRYRIGSERRVIDSNSAVLRIANKLYALAGDIVDLRDELALRK